MKTYTTNLIDLIGNYRNVVVLNREDNVDVMITETPVYDIELHAPNGLTESDDIVRSAFVYTYPEWDTAIIMVPDCVMNARELCARKGDLMYAPKTVQAHIANIAGNLHYGPVLEHLEWDELKILFHLILKAYLKEIRIYNGADDGLADFDSKPIL